MMFATTCAPEPHVYVQSSSNFCEKRLIGEFQGTTTAIPNGRNANVDRNPTDQTKANCKRNKKRVSMKEVEIGSKIGQTYPVIPAGETQSEPILRAASSSSYAAVVSGRNWSELPKSGSFLTGLQDDDFLPLTTMSIFNKKASNTSSRSGPVRDVGVQVNLPIKDGEVPTKSRNQWTMTSKRGQCKNKFVSVKICCNNTNKEMGSSDPQNSIPPVQFLGDDFTFQNALAKTVAQLGIKFMD